tara:strand:+ start:2675 stop:2857 length:183 start_codon:yes stop_codon:yes gene_type:complete
MSIQHERILSLCERLNLSALPVNYSAIAQKAASNNTGYADFLEEVLHSEWEEKQARSRSL